MRGSGDGVNAGFVTVKTYQRTFLPTIFGTYIDRGYACKKVQPLEPIVATASSPPNQHGSLEKMLEVLGALAKLPSVKNFSPGNLYFAIPRSWHNSKRVAVQEFPFWLWTSVEYRGIQVFPHSLTVNYTSVTVLNSDNRPVELNFYEFYTALQKWLPNISALTKRTSRGMKKGI